MMNLNRRDFLRTTGAGIGAVALPGMSSAAQSSNPNFQTKHVVFIINGNGARKKEYFERAEVSPNMRRIAGEGSIFLEDHNNTPSNHGYMFTELLSGVDASYATPYWPTMTHYLRKTHRDEATKYWYVQGISYYRNWRFHNKYASLHPEYPQNTWCMSLTTQNIFFEENRKSPQQIVTEQFPDMDVSAAERKVLEEFVEARLESKDYNPSLKKPFVPRAPFSEEGIALHMIPMILQAFKPRLIIFQQIGHDTGHGAGGFLLQDTGYEEYVKCAESTDEAVGNIYDFIKNDPYFSTNTALIVRPEGGRDDEVNLYNEIHHSNGYYYAHRVASIWNGPDFKEGEVFKDVVNRMEIAPTITKMLGADAAFAKGHVRPHHFKEHVGQLPPYEPPSTVTSA